MKSFLNLFEQQFEEHVGAACFSPDGSQVAIGRLSDLVSLHDSSTGRLIREHKAGTGGIHALQYSPDGRWLAAGGESGILSLIEGEDQDHIRSLDLGADGKSLSRWIEFVVWSQNSKVLAASCGTRVVFIATDKLEILGSKNCESSITSLSLLPDDERVLASCNGGAWLLSMTGRDDDEFLEFPGVVLKALCSPSRRYINAGLLESSVAIWDRQNDEPLMMSGYERKVTEMAWSPLTPRYQKLLFAAGGGRDITLWDFSEGPPDGQRPQFLSGHRSRINDLGFLKRSPWLLSVGNDGDCRVWQGSRDWKPGNVLQHEQPLHQLVLPESEDRLLLLGDKGKVWLYQL